MDLPREDELAYAHELGRAVLHRGAHFHEVEDVTSGARHVAKALGRPTSPATGADTLIMSLCFRRCAIAALDRAVVLEYPGPEAPRAGRGRGWLRRGAD